MELNETLQKSEKETELTPMQMDERLGQVSELIGQGEYEKAQELLDTLPDEDNIYRRQLQAGLYFVQGRFDEGAEVIEHSLLEEAAHLQSSMLLLLEIHLKAGRKDEAGKLADILERFAPLMGLPAYGVYAPQLLMAAAREDVKGCMLALEQMKAACGEKWDSTGSVLYRHLPQPEDFGRNGQAMLAMIVAEFLDSSNGEYEFLRKSPEFWKAVETWRGELEDEA